MLVEYIYKYNYTYYHIHVHLFYINNENEDQCVDLYVELKKETQEKNNYSVNFEQHK